MDWLTQTLRLWIFKQVKGKSIVQKKRIYLIVLASFALLIMFGGLLLIAPQPQEIAHHMAPNDNNADHINLDMVHHGIDLGAMPDAPENEMGNQYRQLWAEP
ncbi:MAG TPA: hypothetical protein DEH25_13745 [Chloroflexi bacterium]|nr:hypothetical protein [Chloroflexota bacterium]HBY07854.1 hypothetical protein [Chloroflexota bacterium]